MQPKAEQHVARSRTAKFISSVIVSFEQKPPHPADDWSKWLMTSPVASTDISLASKNKWTKGKAYLEKSILQNVHHLAYIHLRILFSRADGWLRTSCRTLWHSMSPALVMKSGSQLPLMSHLEVENEASHNVNIQQHIAPICSIS